MARFKKGQTIYMGRGDKMQTLVVEKVHKNPMLPVHLYTFKGKQFVCGEQSIRATKNGRDLKLSECFIEDNEAEFRINTLSNALRQNIDERKAFLPEMSAFDSTRVRFRPSLLMCEWLRDYANGRMLVHVDSGQGHFVRMMKMTKAKAIGIEENYNAQKARELRMNFRGYIGDINEILQGSFEDRLNLIKGMGDKVILVFPRPKSSENLHLAIQEFMGKCEILLIDKEIEGSTAPWKVLEHEGNLEDNEVIYSLK